jgi:SAM-dependent methyltransferase
MTTPHRNPQAQQMSDESMVRNLRAQIECVWPQERPVMERHGLPQGAHVLDVGCGTGEFSAKVLGLRPDVTLLGVDLEESHLSLARERCAFASDRAVFRVDDAYDLDLEDDSVDLAACRHMLQAVPEVPSVLAELVRVTRPGGVVHLVAEDYGLMTFFPTRLDSDDFWYRAAMPFAAFGDTDLRIGRKAPVLLATAGCEDVRVEYVVVDTVRVPRETFADIWRAWRDGYSEVLVERGDMARDLLEAHWADMIGCITSPTGYACWLLPVVTGRVPV